MAREPQQRAQRVDSRGNPVDPGLYRQKNRHGELQDISGNDRVGFHDTFLGDLLGFDGQAGVQGPGMMDSIRGARRADVMRPEPRPDMADAPIDDPMSTSPRPQARPEQTQTEPSAPPDQTDVDEIPRDENGNPLPWVLGGAAAGAAATAAVRRLIKPNERVVPADKNNVALTPDENGMVRVPREILEGGSRGHRYETLTAQQAVDGGWSVVGLNYDSGVNALPAPEGGNAIDSVGERGNQGTDTPAAISDSSQGGDGSTTPDGATRSDADVDAESAAIDDPMRTNADTANNITSRIVPELPEGLAETPDPLNGGVAYRGNGQVFVAMPGGGYLDIAALDPETRRAVLSAMRAVR